MKLAEVSVRRPVFTTVMMLALIVFGAWSYSHVGVDQFPDVDIPIAAVTAIYPGADPETIEAKVVDPLEEALNTISGIDALISVSAESAGIITIQFELERDVDQALQDVRDQVAASLRNLPADLEPPVVQKFDVGAAPIMSLVVSGQMPTRELTQIAEDVVKAQLQTISGVGAVLVVGGQEREFQINVDPVALQGFGLTVEDVARSVGAQNIEIPGGRITTGAVEYTLKTQGQVHSAAELADLVLGAPAGRVIRLGDVAEVRDAEEERRSYALLDGATAVSLTIQKQSGANTVAVAKAVHKQLESIRADLAGQVEIAVPIDNSVYIEHAIGDVQFDLLFGAILAVLIIMFFLRDWRATLISALALPTSVIATIAFINAMGFTFNIMTMLALTLSIGILIDDAIVVIENIYRHIEMGKTPRQAALDGTSEIGLAVLAITASIVAVFLPVATMKGIIGRFFFQFGMTVTFAVSVSLFVAFTLTPMLSARMLKSHGHQRGAVSGAIERALDALERAYAHLVSASLRHPFVTGLVAVAAFAGSLALFRTVPIDFMPAEDRGEFRVFVEMPTGTSLARTRGAVDHVVAEVGKIPGVALTFATIGGGARNEVNKASIHVELVPKSERTFSQHEAMAYVRELFPDSAAMAVAVEPIQPISPAGGAREGDLQYLLQGDDYDELEKAADAIIAELAKRGGYVDLDKSLRSGKPELQISIDRAAAADLGVPVASIAMAIRMLYAGDKVSEIATDGDRFDARVRIRESLRDDPASLLNVSVRSMSGALVPLSQVVRVEDGRGPAQIDRYNRQRQVTILANLQGRTLGEAVAEISAITKEVAPGIKARPIGRAESLGDTGRYMVEAMLLTVILIFLILAAQFESFVHPLTIMVSLPLSFIGAFGALALTGMTMNIFTMIGLIMLMGLVTKNAVLLVDYTNVLRARGESRRDALVHAGRVRLRPILMTTAAMIGGMMPVALALSAGGEQRAPMAVAVIGGLITSTLLTLVVVPVVYQALDQLVARLGFGRPERDEADPGTDADVGEPSPA